jgi:radical SAM-linked protein
MAYSSGFSPHPRISYPNAAPTGAASEAEYVEIGLATMCDPDKVKDALNAALPLGLDVLDVIAAPPGALAGKLTASHWQVELPGLSAAALSMAVEAFLTSDKVPVQRMTKTGLREFDARAAVIALDVADARLSMTLVRKGPYGAAGRHSDRPTGLSPDFTLRARFDPAPTGPYLDSGTIIEPGR